MLRAHVDRVAVQSNGFSNTFQAKPGEIIPPWVKVWTLITAGYIETDVLSVVVDACALVWAAKVLDPAWGTKEFGVRQRPRPIQTFPTLRGDAAYGCVGPHRTTSGLILHDSPPCNVPSSLSSPPLSVSWSSSMRSP